MNFFDFARSVNEDTPSPFTMKTEFSAAFEQPREAPVEKHVTFSLPEPQPAQQQEAVDVEHLDEAIEKLDQDLALLINWVDPASRELHDIECQASELFNEADAFINSIKSA